MAKLSAISYQPEPIAVICTLLHVATIYPPGKNRARSAQSVGAGNQRGRAGSVSCRSLVSPAAHAGSPSYGTTGCVHATSTSPFAYGFGCGFDEITFART